MKADSSRPENLAPALPQNRRETFQLDDRVAIVTGGARGLGYTMALYLAEFGAHIAVADIDDVGAAKAAERIREIGVRAIAVPTDVSKLPSITSAVETVREEFGKIDILVNSAGINIREEAFDVSEEHWDRILDVNLKGLFFITQAVARVMKEQKYGRIIHIASHMAKIALPLRAAYCASKGGIASLTRELSLEWAPYNININAIAPSFFTTPMNKPLFDDPVMSRFITENTPLGRPGDPEELGGPVVFLASPASSFVTGHTLVVDGGFTAR
jgi:NAD(P)-dependent dehydrogenase (short-subunit alcohol dehydrogenase family)